MNMLCNNKTQHNVMRILLTVLLTVFVFVLLLGTLGYSPFPVSYAEEVEYSDVLDDLRQDPNFDESTFTTTFSGLDMELIQIIETSENELYVYFHFSNPFFTSLYNKYPTEIRFATATGENAKWSDYLLTELSVNGAWGKYRVEGFTVSTTVSDRIYNIPCFFRPFYSKIDNEAEGGDKQGYTAVNVSQEWTVSTIAGTKTYSKKEADVIVVTSLYLGKYFTVKNALFKPETLTMYYCAFDTDIRMDDVFEVDVEYWHASWHGSSYEKDGDKIEKTLKKGDTTGSIIKYNFWTGASTSTPETDEKFATIQSKDEFLGNWSSSFSDSANARLEDKKWVLVLEHFSVSYALGTKLPPSECFTLDDFSILRLNFMKDGRVYNLGVVDNKRTSDTQNSAAGESASMNKFILWLKGIMSKLFGWDIANIKDWQAILFLIIAVIVLIPIAGLLIGILVPFLPTIFTGLVNLLILVGKGLFWLISAPVRLIMSLFDGKGK